MDARTPAVARFEWERAVISERGPASSTTKLALLILGTHLNREGNAWPSELTLAKEAGLSERSIITHLDIAVAGGWITRTVSKAQGKAWRRYTYAIAIPPLGTEQRSATCRGDGAEPRSIANGVLRTVAGAHATEPDARGTEPDNSLVLNHLQTNKAVNISNYNSKYNKDSVLKEKKMEQPKDVKQWAKELGIEELPGEHPGAFQVRVADAVAKHKPPKSGRK